MKCLKRIVRHYWKNWTQPTNPSGITATSGWENPMNAFDNNADTYARCNSTTEYIEYDFGEEIYLTGINSNGIQINGQAVATSLVVNYFDRANVETLLVHTTRSSEYDSYTNNATFNATKTSKVRIYIDTTYSGAPSRTIQITFLGYKEGTLHDYDFYTDEEVSELPKKTVTTYWKTIQEYTTAGTETLNLTDGTYKIIAVGGGSGGSYVKDNYDSQYKFGAVGGASGAACVAVFDLQQGSYTVTVGAGGIGRGGWFGGSYPSDPGGSTTFSKDGTDIVNCGGGAYSEAIWNYYGFQVHVGAGGTATTSGEKKIVLKEDGKSAGYATGYTDVSGAQSVYNSYGSGGSASAGGNYANAGTAGYFKILIQSDSSDYDVVETETTWYGINQ